MQASRNRHNEASGGVITITMKRWLMRVTPDRRKLENHWCFRHFTAVMLDRRCWTFNRSNVTRSFALGLFIAFIPPTPLPVHLLACALLGVYFRLNLPVLVATVFLSTPSPGCRKSPGPCGWARSC